MAVRIRMKKMGRRHRPFFRICVMDARTPRDGKVIEEVGYYDPMVKETDARAVLKADRIDYWLSVGAQPTEKVKVLIKKYGTGGTHRDKQREALERLKLSKPQAPPPIPVPKPEPEEEPAAEAAPEEPTAEEQAPAAEAAAEPPAGEAVAEQPAAEAEPPEETAEQKDE